MGDGRNSVLAMSFPCRMMGRVVPSLEAVGRDGRPAFGRNGQLVSGDSSRSGGILVVDDDPAVRQMVMNYLASHHMRALGAPGRQELMSHLAQSEPDLAI